MQNWLSSLQAKELLQTHGYNVLKDQKKRSLWEILRWQIKWNFMIYFMVFAAILSFAVAKTTTAYAVLWVIFAIVLVWFFQEFKAERAVNALKNMLESFSTVIRDGKETQISSKELVPWDIVLLETWEKIPADCLILEAKDLMLNESILTWESKEISKVSIDNSKMENNSDSLIFMGTYIVNGRAVVQVLKTWMHTEFGKIASMISAAEKELPLQKKVNRLVRFMATIAVVVSLLSGAVMLFNLETWTSANIVEILLISIALMISAFPEWLPVVMISTLAWGAYKMAKKKAIVSRMSIIETLWETTVICSDKTWTITKWEMTVKEIITFEDNFEVTWIWYETKWDFLLDSKKIKFTDYPVLNQLLESSILCNNAHIINQEKWRKFKWTPTEIALMVLWHKANLVEDIIHFQRLEELPFNSERKMMSVLVEKEWKKIVYSKWAPEMFLPHCTHIQTQDKIQSLWKSELEKITNKISELTKKKYRVLCIGYKILDKNNIGELEEKIILLWCVGLQDSPREWVLWAVQSCYDAGIKVKMITGDNKDTAVAIANDVWIFGRAVTGDELDNMTDEELKSIIQDVWIFARVKPEHKIRIVKVLKELWEIVTMTWDGVNDAPALKEAHIWVAMWINGTDVSREAADLILEDDNFVTIVNAVEEWRTIFKNIQKFVVYQLSVNIAELSVIFISVLVWLPVPLIAIQILFMNLVTDNLPAITLWFTTGSGYIMKLKARKNSNILNTKKKLLLVWVWMFMALVSLLVYVIALKKLNRSLESAQTLVLLTLIMFEISNAFNFRSLYASFFQTKISRNIPLIYASIISLLATAAIMYIPFLQKVFETHPLSWQTWVVTFLISLSIIVVVDIIKHINKNSFEDYGTNA